MEVDDRVDLAIEKGLGSVGKLKVLRLLLGHPVHAFTRYELGKTISNDPVSIKNDLETLVQLGWVTEFKVRHLSKYSVNLENAVVRRLRSFLQEVRYLK